MRLSLVLMLFAAVALAGCGGEAPALPDVAGRYDAYGAALDAPEEAVPVDAVLAEPAPYLRQTVRVSGTVAEVCQQKGCWLTLDGGEAGDVRIFVAKDDTGGYRFTVPRDISGRHVVVEGWLEAAELDAATQQHLAEDAGEPVPEAPEPRRELQLTADAVLVQKTASPG